MRAILALLALLWALPANAQLPTLPMVGRQAALGGYRGPGDVVSGATAFYSLVRGYNAAYAASGTNAAFIIYNPNTSTYLTINVLTSGYTDLATAASFCGTAQCYITTVFNQISGSWVNLTTPGGSPSPGPGYVGAGYQYTCSAGNPYACGYMPGIAGYLSTATSPQGPQSGFTLLTWTQMTSNTVTGFINAQYDDGGAGDYLQFFQVSSGVLHGRIESSGSTYIGRTTAASALNTGWQYLGMTWDGGTSNASIALYVNGISADTANDGLGTFTAPATANIPFIIGAQRYSGGYNNIANMNWAETLVYPTGLSSGSIASLNGNLP